MVGSQQTYFQLRAAFLSLAPSSAKGYYATVEEMNRRGWDEKSDCEGE